MDRLDTTIFIQRWRLKANFATLKQPIEKRRAMLYLYPKRGQNKVARKMGIDP